MDNLKSRRPQQAVVDGEADAGGAGRTDINFLCPPLVAFPEEVEKQVGLGGRVVLRAKGEGVFAIVFDGEETALPVPALSFGAEDDPAAQAHLLFDLLRECDERGAKEVYVRSPRTTGIGLAVYNRLLRAAAFQIVHLDESGVAAQ